MSSKADEELNYVLHALLSRNVQGGVPQKAEGNPGLPWQHQRKVKNTQIYEFYHFPKMAVCDGGRGTCIELARRMMMLEDVYPSVSLCVLL